MKVALRTLAVLCDNYSTKMKYQAQRTHKPTNFRLKIKFKDDAKNRNSAVKTEAWIF